MTNLQSVVSHKPSVDAEVLINGQSVRIFLKAVSSLFDIELENVLKDP